MLDELQPIALQDVVDDASLQRRVDSKHIAPVAKLDSLLAAIAPTHRVLEVAETRIQAYDSIYFDCPRLTAYRAHLQGRRRRFKIRTRRYEATGYCTLEVKFKGGRGLTIKERLPIPAADHGGLSERDLAFVDESLERAYGAPAPRPLAATLRTRFDRITLVNPAAQERITIDQRVRYGDLTRDRFALSPEYVLIETKSLTGRGPAELALRELGSRPRRVSKYCVGVGLCREDVHGGVFTGPLRRYLKTADG